MTQRVRGPVPLKQHLREKNSKGRRLPDSPPEEFQFLIVLMNVKPSAEPLDRVSIFEDMIRGREMQNRDVAIYFGEYWVKTTVEFWTAVSFPAIFLARHL